MARICQRATCDVGELSRNPNMWGELGYQCDMLLTKHRKLHVVN